MDGSTVNIFGDSFSIDGVEVPDLQLGQPFTITERDVELAGNLADGSPFQFFLNSNEAIDSDFFAPSATLTVNLTSSVDGDYDNSGQVDQGDLDLVLLNWGRMLADPFAARWINDSPAGIVDQDALDGILLSWGAGSNTPPIAASVPESEALYLALLAAMLAMVCVRRNRGR
jgi:hypothetical protein